MKRFHVHVVVPTLDESVRFYRSMFGAEPSVLKDDYAKWMLEDPRMNFAISARGVEAGVNHLGFQVDSDDELTALRAQVTARSVAVQDQPGAQLLRIVKQILDAGPRWCAVGNVSHARRHPDVWSGQS